MKKAILFASLLLAIMFGSAQAQNPPVFVYHSAWGDPAGIDHDWFEHNGSFVSHIIHFKIDPLNVPPYMTFDGGEGNHARNRSQIIADAHARGIKVLLCIGGVTKFTDQHCTGQGGADMWECITSDSVLTETVIDAMRNYALTYGYDGFDLDWEAKFNATNLGFLLRRLRADLDTWPTRGILTIATGRTAGSVWPISTMNATCDYINIMLYDGNAYWSCNGGSGGISGFHEPLRNPAPNYANYCWDGSVVNSEYCLSTWESSGIDKSKTNPSIAFYGWSWKGVTAPGQQQSGCASNCAGYASYMDAANMIAAGGTYHYDNLASQAWVSLPGAAYSYVNYVDAASVAAKMNYYRSHGWGGIMCFANEHAADVTKPSGSDARFPLLTAVRNNLAPQTPTAPTFSSQPSNSSIWVGERATFSVIVNGYPQPSLQWQKNGVNISGATSNSYTTPVVTSADNGATYRCVASNSAGSVTSNQAVLTVSTPVPANVTSDDFHDAATSNSLWRFSQPARTRFAGAGTQDAWLVIDIPSGTRLDYWTDVKNAPAALQNISNGDFEVVARFQSVSSAKYQSQGIVVKQDANTLLRFDCNYGGNGLAFFSGLLSGSNVTVYSTTAMTGISNQVWIKVKRTGNSFIGWYSSDGVNYLQASQFSASINADSIGVFVANGDPGTGVPPGITSNIDYFFNTSSPINPEDPVGSATPPTFTTQPANSAVTAGQAATFRVQVSCTPAATLQWQKNGVNISGATTATYTTPATVQNDSGSVFKCIATNVAGTAASAPAILSVNSAATAPTFTTQPVNKSVLAGQTATFTVQVAGSPTPSLQWQKNGSNIAGATSNSYTTTAVTLADSGSSYRCVASNSAGTVTSSAAILSVSVATSAPAFTQQPSNASVLVGQTATFSVQVTGSPAPTLQWQKNGVNISGATGSSYSTPAATLADSGAIFRCIATNSAGSATSNSATLSVTSPSYSGTAVSDDFHDTTRSKSLWRFSQPGRSRFAGTGTQDAWLVMDIPTGTRLDYWTDLKNAPTAFQDISNGDFEVVARFQSLPNAMYQTEGFVIKQDASKLLRLDCTYGAGGLQFFAVYLNGSSSTILASVPISGVSSEIYLKVRRSGNTWTGSYSANGTTFTQAAQFAHVITADSLGVFVANGIPYGGVAPGITCKVDYVFNTSSPLSPEDPLAALPTGTFTSDKTLLPYRGGNVVLTWTSNGATSASIDKGIGAVPVSGSKTVFVANTTTFSLSLTNANGTRKYTRLITVERRKDAPIVTNDITSQGQPSALIMNPISSASLDLEVMRDGVTPTAGEMSFADQYQTLKGGEERAFDWIGYTFDASQNFRGLVYQEGVHSSSGGYFESAPRVQVRVNGEWIDASGVTITPQYVGLNAENYATYSIAFDQIAGDAIRLAGTPGGTEKYISVAELRVMDASAGTMSVSEKPEQYSLMQNFPNPFNPTTTIEYAIPDESHAMLSIYNALGQEVATLVNEQQRAGRYSINWNASAHASGIYFYKLTAVGANGQPFTLVRKLMLLK